MKILKAYIQFIKEKNFLTLRLWKEGLIVFLVVWLAEKLMWYSGDRSLRMQIAEYGKYFIAVWYIGIFLLASWRNFKRSNPSLFKVVLLFLLISQTLKSQENIVYHQFLDKNLIYMRARCYDPETGSFLTKDPIGVNGGVNTYQYAYSDPINKVDPNGLVAPLVALGIYAAAAGSTAGLVDVGVQTVPKVLSGTPLLNQDDGTPGALSQVDFTQLATTTIFGTLSGGGSSIIGSSALSNSAKVTANVLSNAVFNTAQQASINGLEGNSLTDNLGSSFGAGIVFGAIGTKIADGRSIYNQFDPPSDLSKYLSIGKTVELDSRAFSHVGEINAGLNALGNAVGGINPFSTSSPSLSPTPIRNESFSPYNNVSFSSSFNLGGVLIDKAATLIGSNLSDIKGATYDPISKQLIFLGNNDPAAVKDIDLDYFYTAVNAVYGSAVPPFVTLDPPVSLYTQWTDYGDGDGTFEPGEWGGVYIRYNPIWAEEDNTVDLKFTMNSSSQEYRVVVHFNAMVKTNIIAGGRPYMHLVYQSAENLPPGVTLDTTSFGVNVNIQGVPPNTNINGSSLKVISTTGVNIDLSSSGQDSYYPLKVYNGGSGNLVVNKSSIVPDKQHRKFGGRVEGSRLGWVMYEADRVMKCLSVGKDNLTGATYSASTLSDIAGYKNLAEISSTLLNPTGGNIRMWFTPNEMTLNRNVDPVTGQATIVFDKATVKLLTESFLQGVAQDPSAKVFVDHFNANYAAFAAKSFPVMDPNDPTGQTIIQVKIFERLKEGMQAVSLARFFRDNNIPLDMSWLNGWQPNYAYSPKSVATAYNEISVNGIYYLIYGGVQVNKPNDYIPSATAASVGQLIASARPNTSVTPTEDNKDQVWNASTAAGNLTAVSASLNPSKQEGNTILNEVDLVFDSPGSLPLSMARYYQSSTLAKENLGPGWKFVRYALEFSRPSWYDEQNLMVLPTGYPVYRDSNSDTRLRSDTLRVIDRATGAALDFNSSLTLSYSQNSLGNPVISTGGLNANGLPTFTVGDRKNGATLVQNNDTDKTYTATLPDGSTLKFDFQGRILSTTDRYGIAQTYAYDATTKRLLTVTDSIGQALNFTYDPTTGNLTGVTAPNGNSMSYSYDTFGRLEAAVHGRSQVALATYHYNDQNQIIDVQRPSGLKTVQTTPDLKGRSDERKDVRANTAEFYYFQDSATQNRVTSVWNTGSALASTDMGSDSQGRPTYVKDPLNYVTQYAYAGDSKLPTSVTLPTPGRPAIEMQRNAYGLPTQISDPAVPNAQPVGIIYDPVTNLPTDITDTAGRLTKMFYDPSTKDLLKVRRLLNGVPVESEFTYQNGRIKTVKNPLSHTVTYDYDTLGRLKTITDPTGVQIKYTYDTQGRLWKITDPKLTSDIIYAYDDLDRVLTVTTPVGVTTREYDPVTKWLKKTTDVQGRSLEYTYNNSNGDVTQATYRAPVGENFTPLVTDYGYNRLGVMSSVTPPGAKPITFNVDDLGRLQSTNETDSGIYLPPTGLDSLQADNKVWTNQKNHTFVWGAPQSDSPVTGYSYAQDLVSDQTQDTTSATTTWNNVTDGKHQFHVRAKNQNNYWSPEATFDLWVDTVPPVITGIILNPALPTQNSSTATIQANVTDALSGVLGTSVRLRWLATGLATVSESTPGWSDYIVMVAGQTVANYQATFTLDLKTHAGEKFYYQIEAIDLAGNLTKSAIQSVAIKKSDLPFMIYTQ